MSKITSFRMEDSLHIQLDELAANLDRPKGWVIEQAVRRYVETEGWQVKAIKDALDEVREGRATLVSHDDVMASGDEILRAHGIEILD